MEVAVHQHAPALRCEHRVGPVAPGQHPVPLVGSGQHSKPGAECIRRGVRRRLRQRASRLGDRPQYPGIVQLGKDRGEIPRGVVPLGGPDPVPHLKERNRRHPTQDQYRRIAGNRCHLGQRQPGRGRPQRVQDLSLMADPQCGRPGPGEPHHEPAVDHRAGRAVLRIVVWLKPSSARSWPRPGPVPPCAARPAARPRSVRRARSVPPRQYDRPNRTDQQARPLAHRASWDDGQTPRGAASSGRRGPRQGVTSLA